MELTITVDLAHTSASLVEKHSFVAGDVYNPLYVDFGSLTPEQAAAIDTGSLVLTIRRNGASGPIVASTGLFSASSQRATDGTLSPRPKVRQTSLALNVQAVRDWFDDEAASQSPALATTAYLEISDSNVTYAACVVPMLLRAFVPGGSTPGYYTSEEVDALLAQKQGLLGTALPLSISGSTLAIAVATTQSAGIVRVGARLSVSPDGTISADDQSQEVDVDFDERSSNAIANSTVAAAVSGLLARLAAIDGGSASTTTIAQMVAAIAGKADSDSLANVATSGSYLDLSDRPTIPSADSVGNKWYAGTAITGTSEAGALFPDSGIESANVGDMYLNTSTANVYRCMTGGSPAVAVWAFVCTIRGQQGLQGVSGEVKATYPSVTAMQAAWATDSLRTGELAIVNTGNVASEDNGRLYRKGLSQYEFLCDLSGNPGSAWYSGTGVTGTSTAPVSFIGSGIVDAHVLDMYLNTETANVYRCVVPGSADVAKWVYAGSIRGARGDDGSAGRPGAMWYTGTAISGTNTSGSLFPSSGVENANVGDLYLNVSVGDVYRCTVAGSPSTAMWVYVMSVKGVQGDAGANGAKWYFGTEVSGETPSPTSIAGGNPVAGDCYLNVSTGDIYSCTGSGESGPTWEHRGNLRGLPGQDGANGTVWHFGTEVAGTVPVEATISDGLPLNVGDMFFNTNDHTIHTCTLKATSVTGTWRFLCELTASGVTAPGTHGSGNIPVWGSGNTLEGGYSVRSGAAVRPRETASDTAIPTEYAVALALASYAMIPSSHGAGTIPAWGDVADNRFETEYSVRKSTSAGGIRAIQYAVDTALVTERAVRKEFDSVADTIATLRLDALAAPQAGSTRLDATSTTHGLMSATDKAKLDDLIAFRSASDIGRDLNDDDVLSAFSSLEGYAGRIFALSRIWTYISDKLLSFHLDDLGTPEDNTDLDVSADRHGLMPKLPQTGGANMVFDGTGHWVINTAAATFEGDNGEGGRRGQVPAPAAGDAAANKFLSANGHWTVPPTADPSAVDIHGRTELPTKDLVSEDEMIVFSVGAGDHFKMTVGEFAHFVNSHDRYDTLWVPAGAMTPGDTNGASVVEIFVSGNQTTHDAMRFPYSTQQETFVDFNVSLPDDWDAGTVKAKLFWRLSGVNSASPDTNVKFGVACAAYGDTDDYSVLLGNRVTVIDTVHGTSEIHITPATPAIPVGGTPAAGKMLHFQVSRMFQALEDSMSADANLLGVLLQYRRSGLQSAW